MRGGGEATGSDPWIQALSLGERRGLEPGGSVVDPERATRRLGRWRAQSPFDREDGAEHWSLRLAAEGLAEDELLALLGESPEALAERVRRARSADTMPWLESLQRWLDEAFADPDPTPVPWPLPGGSQNASEASGEAAGRDPFALLRVVDPLAGVARRRLAHEVSTLVEESEAGTDVPFDSKTAPDLLLGQLAIRLGGLFGRTLVLELQIARLEERLEGDTTEERFASFLREMSRPGALRDLLARYPVLARRTVTVLDAWVQASLDFFRHLLEDAPSLARTFGDPDADSRGWTGLGRLVEARGGAGDSHRGGRSVIHVRFELSGDDLSGDDLSGEDSSRGSELRLVYKPRSLAVEARFQELLAWLNERSFGTPFRTLALVDRHDHGWVEHVEAGPCRDEEEVRRFYRRQGGYLALLHLLEATDFHHENLLAAGEHPVLVDLEALFHPHVEGEAIQRPDRTYGYALRDTVLRVGLLPQRVWGSRDKAGVDLSGLGSPKGQKLPRPSLRVEDAGTDRMRFASGEVTLPGAANRPRLAVEEDESPQDVELLDFAQPLEAGFREVLDLCRRHRDELLALDGPLEGFRDTEVRVVFRPTRGYALLLAETYHPHVQGDGLDLDLLLDRLWSGVPDRPFLQSLIPWERRDLWAGDVPIFTTRPGSRDLFAAQGERIPGFFDQPALDRVRERLQRRLSDDQVELQAWILDGSLQAVRLERRGFERAAYEHQPTPAPAAREELLATARLAGDRLATLALTGPEEAHWLAVQAVAEGAWSLAPAIPDLYIGLPGIALFLGFLGSLEEDPGSRTRFTSLARKALETQRRQIREAAEVVPGIGGFNGWGGVIYALTHLGTLWQDEALWNEAEEIAREHVAGAIEDDEHLDVVAGAAGALLALLVLAARRPDGPALALARRCGEHLVTRAEPQTRGLGWPMPMAGSRALAGISHGVAGIALALLRLDAATGDHRFRDAALAGLEYERSLYSPEHRNWPDLRVRPASDESSPREEEIHGESRYICAWCHGAAGVGLARVAGLPHLDDAEVREEIAAAVATTLETGFGGNHSLCHGDLGNLLLLYRAAAFGDFETEDPDPMRTVARHAGGVLRGIEEHGFLPGLAVGTEPPGLMVGLAGMGWALLQLAEPDRVPDVLTLS